MDQSTGLMEPGMPLYGLVNLKIKSKRLRTAAHERAAQRAAYSVPTVQLLRTKAAPELGPSPAHYGAIRRMPQEVNEMDVPVRTMSPLGVAASIFSCCLGSGALVVPSAFASGGLLYSAAMTAAIALTTAWSGVVLVSAANRLDAHSLSEVVKSSWGSNCARLTSLSILLLLVGVVCANAAFVVDSFVSLLQLVGVEISRSIIAAVFAAVLLLVGSGRDAKIYAALASYNFLILFGLVLYVIATSTAELVESGAKHPDLVLGTGPGGTPGILLFLFLPHPILIELYRMLHSSSGHGEEATSWSSLLFPLGSAFTAQVVLVVVIGVVGAYAYGPGVAVNLLDELPTMKAEVVVARAALVVALSLMLLSLLGFIRSIVFDDLFGRRDASDVGQHSASRPELAALNATVLAIVAGVVIAVPNVGTIIGVLSAVLGFLLAFALPCALHWISTDSFVGRGCSVLVALTGSALSCAVLVSSFN